MGPLFVILFWLLIGAVAGLIAGIIVTFVLLPMYYTFRNMPRRRRFFKGTRKLVFFSIVVLGGLMTGAFIGVWPMVHATIYQDDFEQYAGMYDSFRTALSYPYELTAIDDLDRASIGIWKEDGAVVSNVVQLQSFESHVLGATYTGMESQLPNDFSADQLDWFILDCRTGVVSYFDDYDAFVLSSAMAGVTDRPDLITVKEQLFARSTEPDGGMLVNLSNAMTSLVGLE